jgi:KDO2-lipid IV(A) lauroyltransferase
LNSQKDKRILFAQEINATDGGEIFDRYHIWLENQIEKSPEEWYGWIHRRYLSTTEFTKHTDN